MPALARFSFPHINLIEPIKIFIVSVSSSCLISMPNAKTDGKIINGRNIMKEHQAAVEEATAVLTSLLPDLHGIRHQKVRAVVQGIGTRGTSPRLRLLIRSL